MPPAGGAAGGVLTTSNDYTLFLGRVELAVAGDAEPVKAALRASLGGCDRPLVEPRVRAELRVDAAQATLDGEVLAAGSGPQAIEAALYARLPAWHPRTWLLHAAALVVRGKPALLIGEAGQGKSTLARDILERGASYLTDDLVFFDGDRLWGLPRALQFDPVPAAGAQAEGVLRGCDLSSYRVEGPAGPMALPLWPVAPERVADAVDPEGAKLIFVRRTNSTSMHPLDPARAATRLRESVVGEPSADDHAPLESLLERGACWELDWDRGHRAWGHLRALLSL